MRALSRLPKEHDSGGVTARTAVALNGQASHEMPLLRQSNNHVIDSRLGKDGEMIRRRRECIACSRRFTTYERVEEAMPMVVKKDGRRETFDRLKIINGLKRACQKRPVSMDAIEAWPTASSAASRNGARRRCRVPSSARPPCASCTTPTRWPTSASPRCTVPSRTSTSSWPSWRTSSTSGRNAPRPSRRARGAGSPCARTFPRPLLPPGSGSG